MSLVTPIVRLQSFHGHLESATLLPVLDPVRFLRSSRNLCGCQHDTGVDWLSAFSGSVIKLTMEDVGPEENDCENSLNHHQRLSMCVTSGAHSLQSSDPVTWTFDNETVEC